MHQFCPVVAKEFGVNIAIFLQNLAFWTQTNLANEKHIYDGYCWTYNTLKAFQKIFPYFSKQNLETIINSCLKHGLIIKGNYNKIKYDRTAWYALTPKTFEYFKHFVDSECINLLGEAFKAISYFQEIDFPKSRNGNLETKKPIPDNKPDNKTDSISESVDSPIVNDIVNQVLDAYHETLPEMPKVKHVTTELSRAIKKMEAEWPSLRNKVLTKEVASSYFEGLKELTPFLLQPYKTKDGNIRRNRLINLVRLDTIKKFYNGDYDV